MSLHELSLWEAERVVPTSIATLFPAILSSRENRIVLKCVEVITVRAEIFGKFDHDATQSLQVLQRLFQENRHNFRME